ncbi:MAG: hypothetical protein ACLT9W_00870 [Streptococcus sp.]
MVVLKRSPKWWIGMAAVGDWLVLGGLVSVSSPLISNNQQFSQPSKRVKTKDPISNKIVKLAILTRKPAKCSTGWRTSRRWSWRIRKGLGQMPQKAMGPQGNGPDNGMNIWRTRREPGVL